jgi:release factor glutamine methyltransferase
MIASLGYNRADSNRSSILDYLAKEGSKMDKLEIANKIKYSLANNPYGVIDFMGGEVIVLPTVCSVDCSTPFLAEQMSEVASRITKGRDVCNALEMGAGSGAAILTVAKVPGVVASATDINPMSAICVQANALWWKVPCKAYHGNLFEPIPEGERFDLIFWNTPFISTDPGGVDAPQFRAEFDVDYAFQREFLRRAGDFLAENGEIYLCVDSEMSDMDVLNRLYEEYGFDVEIWRKNQEDSYGLVLNFMILKLQPKTKST